MSPNVATSRPTVKAVLTALRAAWPGTGPTTHRVGDGEAPADKRLPYGVLYRAGGGPLTGPVGDQHADGSLLLQLTCVGETAEQAEWLADKLRPVLLATPAGTGRGVIQVYLETSQPVRRDDSSDPPLFYAADQARYLTTPA